MKNMNANLSQYDICELTAEELSEIEGGGIFRDLGYCVGKALGYAALVAEGLMVGASESARQFDGAFAAH